MRGLEAAQDREQWLERAAAFSDGAVLNLVGQAHTAALWQSPDLGATQIKSLVAALSGAVDVLERTRRLATGDDAEMIRLRVEVMSPDEEHQVRTDAEREAVSLMDRGAHTEAKGLDGASESTESPQTPADDPAAPTPAADAQPAHTAATDADSDDHPLAGPLRQLAGREGVQRLQAIALSVGPPAPRDLDSLIDALVEHADADPYAATAIEANLPRTA